MLRQADQVLYRRVTWSDFSAMHGGFASRSGGGARHISLSTSMRTEIADFFHMDDPGEEDEVEHAIELEPVEGIPNSEGPITVSYEVRGSDRTEWRIPDQDENRYVLWDDSWFPAGDSWNNQDEYREDETTPIIYFIRDIELKFHARALGTASEGNLQKFPRKIRSEWRDAIESYYGQNNCGIINLKKGVN